MAKIALQNPRETRLVAAGMPIAEAAKFVALFTTNRCLLQINDNVTDRL
jgi:hypothetical protein